VHFIKCICGIILMRFFNKGEKKMDIKQLDKNIKSIKLRGKNLDILIQTTAIGAIVHAMEHGNNTPLTNLVNAMPKSGRKQALIKYLVDHTPYNWKSDKEKFTKPKNPKRQFMLEEAKEVPFWEYTVEKEPSAIDVNKAIESLIKRVSKAQEEGREVKNVDTLKLVVEAINEKL